MANRRMLLTSTLSAAGALPLLKPQLIKKIWRPLYLVALSLMPGVTSVALADTFTTIDFPGAAFTLLDGINPRGDMVGRYNDTAGVGHGFLLSGGEFTSITLSNILTTGNGINPRGDIVGRYHGDDGLEHGYLLSKDGEFTSFLSGPPGGSPPCGPAECVSATGITPRGDIVGNYTTGNGITEPWATHGYLLNGGPGGDFSLIDFPGASRTAALGINPRGDIVGNATIAGVKHGFLLSGGNFTLIDVPGSAMPPRGGICATTCALGINARGDIVGAYTTADGVNHGYLLSRGEFTSIDFPGAIETFAHKINPRGDTVGRYFSADGIQHGFLLTR